MVRMLFESLLFISVVTGFIEAMDDMGNGGAAELF